MNDPRGNASFDLSSIDERALKTNNLFLSPSPFLQTHSRMIEHHPFSLKYVWLKVVSDASSSFFEAFIRIEPHLFNLLLHSKEGAPHQVHLEYQSQSSKV